MTINFKGIQNVGSYTISNENGKVSTINMELTNKNGKDLDSFETVIKKFPNKTNKNFINLMYANFGGREQYILNGKPLRLEGDNFGIFSKITGALKKIQTNEKPQQVSNDYLESPDCKEMLAGCLEKDSKKSDEEQLLDLHSDSSARKNAKIMEDTIQHTMEDYFA